jgi:hypothetical protein
MTDSVETWKIRYHDKHTEVIPASEYSVILEGKLLDMNAMYPFRGDSRDYYILRKAVKAIANVPGLVCEVGLREGGGMKIILDELIANRKPWTVISIDPYGSIPFKGADGEELDSSEYSNRMKCETLEKMYRFIGEHPNINWLFFPLEDTEFFKRYKDGVPVYTETTSSIQDKYSLVHFDGPHETDVVMNEVEWFTHPRRHQIGTMFVFDDVKHFYDHDQIEVFLFAKGYELIEKTNVKAMYRRMK